MDKSRSSKSNRVRDYLPSIRPSFLSLILVFACGYIWLKNEATNDRLIALENRINMFPLEGHAESGSPKEKYVGTTSNRPTDPTVDHSTRLPDYPSVTNVSEEPPTTAKPRNRREALEDTPEETSHLNFTETSNANFTEPFNFTETFDLNFTEPFNFTETFDLNFTEPFNFTETFDLNFTEPFNFTETFDLNFTEPLDGNFTEPLDRNFTEPLDGNFTEPLNGNFTEPLDGNFTEPLDGNFTEPLDGNFTEPLDGNFTVPLDGNFTEPLDGNFTEPLDGIFTEPHYYNFTEPLDGNFTEPLDGNFTEPLDGNFTEPHYYNFTEPLDGNFTEPLDGNFTVPHYHNFTLDRNFTETQNVNFTETQNVNFTELLNRNFTIPDITMDDILEEINKYIEKLQLIPMKYCNSSGIVCPAGPAGPPGPPGTTGAQGYRGKRGKKGRTGDMGPPGISGMDGTPGPSGENGDTGETGMPGDVGPPGMPGDMGSPGMPGDMGPPGMDGTPGPAGDKGETGEPGLRGMPGPRGRHGNSTYDTHVVVSPAEQTRDMKGNATFYCTVDEKRSPGIEWRFEGSNLLSGAKYLISDDGVLTIRNLNYNDAGQYTCVATDVDGSTESTANLTVQGPPIFTKMPRLLAKPMQYSTLQEACQAEGFPTPKINWYRSFDRLPAAGTEVINGTLTIRNVSPADSGLYECYATNSLGVANATMSIVVQQVNCDCWRSKNKHYQAVGWGYDGPNGRDTDVIDFRTDGDVILQGFRMWGVAIGSSPLDVTIRLLYSNNDSLIAERSGRFNQSIKDHFEVHFSQGIFIRSGVKYTAWSKMKTTRLNDYCYYHTDGMKKVTCSGVTVTFKPTPRRKTTLKASTVYWGQIAAFILRSSEC